MGSEIKKNQRLTQDRRKELDRNLTNRRYLVGNGLTVAGVAVYVALHSTVVSTSFLPNILSPYPCKEPIELLTAIKTSHYLPLKGG